MPTIPTNEEAGSRLGFIISLLLFFTLLAVLMLRNNLLANSVEITRGLVQTAVQRSV